MHLHNAVWPCMGRTKIHRLASSCTAFTDHAALRHTAIQLLLSCQSCHSGSITIVHRSASYALHLIPDCKTHHTLC